jgi:hypothetical protein
MRDQKKFEAKWDIKAIKEYFANIELPDEIVLDDYCTIINVSKFVQRHIEYVDRNNGNPTYRRYYIRLKQLKNLLDNQAIVHRGDHSTIFQNKLQ